MRVVVNGAFEAGIVLLHFEAVFPEFGELSGEIDAGLILLPLGVEFADLLVDHVEAADHAVFLFEGGRLILVLDQIAVVLGCFPAPGLHGRHCGRVLAELEGFEVGRVDFGDADKDFHCPVGVPHLEMELTELVHDLGVFGVAFDDGFQGECGDFRQAGGLGGLFQKVVELGVERVGFQVLFGQFHGLKRVLFHH